MATLPGDSEWPVVGWEELQWRPGTGGGFGRRELAEQAGTYLAAVPASIARASPRPGAQALLAVDIATAAVARLDAGGVGSLLPHAQILLRSESASSSQIERLTASPRALAEAELGLRGRGNAPQIVANTRAMQRALALSSVSADGLLDMHRVLMDGADPGHAGRWRGQQVWIGGSDAGPRGAAFVPPHHRHVPAAIDDLVEFSARTDLPALVQAAIAHAQFETIHPFTDGNGRTGRALLHVLLQQNGLLAGGVVPISSGLLSDVDAYFRALDAYRDGDIDPIVTQISRAAARGAENAAVLIDDLDQLRARWPQTLDLRRDATAWRVLRLLPQQPVIDSVWLAEHVGEAAATNPRRTLLPLIGAGILVESLGEGRRRVWRAPEVLDALAAFSDRSGRRRTPALQQDPPPAG